MAKDYFQDILPPQNNGRSGRGRNVPLRKDPDVRPSPTIEEPVAPLSEFEADDDTIAVPPDVSRAMEEADSAPEKSIRNISAPRHRVRDDMGDTPRYSVPMPKPKRPRRKWLWGIAIVFLMSICILFLIALRGTSVTVEPRSHTVVFDETSRFTAYPQQTATEGMLTYTTQTVELEDSEPVASSGTTHAEEKASGIITVYNDFQSSPVRLVKNTRFESANGLIFRAPADIVVPGKSGSAPGQVAVTIIADQVGAQYNIESGKLTIPGLKGGAEYDKVYGEASAAFSGGFSGERPAIAEGALEGARTAVRGRLEQKIRESVSALSSDTNVTFPEIAQVTYTALPTTAEADGARIHEKATALVPLLPAPQFALAVARTVSADAESASIRMVGMKDFGGLLVSASSTPGVDPVQFQLTGQAMLIWDVNASELAQALAGRDQSAFQTIVTGFSGIQSAQARIEPFWSTAFPGDAGRIRITIKDPSKGL